MFKRSYNQAYFENALYKAERFSARDQNRLEAILKYKNRGQLLEIGCGEGYLLKLLAEHFSVTGIEISAYAAKLAADMVGKNQVVKADIERYSLKNNRYDMVVAFNILEHLKDPALMLEKLAKALKNNGILIGSVPNNYGFLGGLATEFSNFLDKTHISTYEVTQWQQLFAETGFKKVAEFGEVPIGRNNSFYIENESWPHYSFNYLFVYQKGR